MMPRECQRQVFHTAVTPLAWVFGFKKYLKTFFEKLAGCQLHRRQTDWWCCYQIGDPTVFCWQRVNNSQMTPVSTTPVPIFFPILHCGRHQLVIAWRGKKHLKRRSYEGLILPMTWGGISIFFVAKIVDICDKNFNTLASFLKTIEMPVSEVE
jgi:hypothetical protein